MVWECMPRKCVEQIRWMKSQLRSHLATMSPIIGSSPAAAMAVPAAANGVGICPACPLGGEAE
jgi:hypothetical protein